MRLLAPALRMARQVNVLRSSFGLPLVGLSPFAVRGSIGQAVLVILAMAMIDSSRGMGAEASESFLRRLSPGLVLTNSAEVPMEKAKAIGRKLGGEVTRVTNSNLSVHGRPIQINALTAVDEASAKAIHKGLLRIKPDPFCLKWGRTVIEYTGRGIDDALAIKTSYELGLVEKPRKVRYRVVAELATIDKADYMACTPLFNQFLALNKAASEDTAGQIADLAKRFTFGRSLVLRSPRLGAEPATHRFQPDAARAVEAGPTMRYSFDGRRTRQGVPYVVATLEIPVDDSGLCREKNAPSESLCAATPYWPVEAPQIQALARQITQGKKGNDAKALAILEWLAPDKNLRAAGQTGSRWGVVKVLEQRFGHCWDSSDCFVSLCRAAGVPCRQVAGWLFGTSGHVWAEYYSEGKGWQQVDPTGGGKLRCGIYHIAWFTSEDGEMPIVYVAAPSIKTERARP